MFQSPYAYFQYSIEQSLLALVTTLGAVITPLYICLVAVYRIRALAIKAELIHSNVIWAERR